MDSQHREIDDRKAQTSDEDRQGSRLPYSVRQAADDLRSSGRSVLGEAGSAVKEVANEARQAGERQVQAGVSAVAQRVESVGDTAKEVSDTLANRDFESLAQYTASMGDSIKQFGSSLNERSIQDLISDANKIAKRNPTLFVLGSVAAGFAITRFLKATEDSRGSAGGAPGSEPGSSGHRARSSHEAAAPMTSGSSPSRTPHPGAAYNPGRNDERGSRSL